MRQKVFRRLIEEFGRYGEWEGERVPVKGNPGRYHHCLDELALELSSELRTSQTLSPKAVQQQIDFGITQQRSLYDQSHIRTYLLNTAAALFEGFLVEENLPAKVTIEHDGTGNEIVANARPVNSSGSETIRGAANVWSWIEQTGSLLAAGRITAGDLPVSLILGE